MWKFWVRWRCEWELNEERKTENREIKGSEENGRSAAGGNRGSGDEENEISIFYLFNYFHLLIIFLFFSVFQSIIKGE